MSPAVSPAGADRIAESAGSSAETAPEPLRFSRAAARQIVGVSESQLELWEQAAWQETGRRPAVAFTFADLLALAILREVSRRLGRRAGGFSAGLGQLFLALAEKDDVERIDDLVALVGPHFARLAKVRSQHIRCEDETFVVVPLGPILADFRDQVFS